MDGQPDANEFIRPDKQGGKGRQVMEHTKGNWKEVGAFVISENGVDICSTCSVNHLPLEEQVANAHLIAAAPDLLDALENFPLKIGNQTLGQFYNCCMSWNRVYRQTAIEKAK